MATPVALARAHDGLADVRRALGDERGALAEALAAIDIAAAAGEWRRPLTCQRLARALALAARWGEQSLADRLLGSLLEWMDGMTEPKTQVPEAVAATGALVAAGHEFAARRLRSRLDED